MYIYIHTDLLTRRFDVIYRVGPVINLTILPDLAPTRATYARLFDPTRLVDSLRLKLESKYRLLPVSLKSSLSETWDSNNDGGTS